MSVCLCVSYFSFPIALSQVHAAYPPRSQAPAALQLVT
jgi:hypothetical protein